MKRLVVFGIILSIASFTTLIPSYVKQMRLKAKADEYTKQIEELKKKNLELTKKRDILKRADYDTIRKEATNLGLIKEEERIIRFYKK
ncbi:MAG: septum formation initiator family protein [bacterium]